MNYKKTAVVAMSGGVDSSVCALIMKQAGYNVIGVTMDMFSGYNGYETDVLEKKANYAITDAAIAAKHIGVEHHVIDVQSEFKNKVIDRFIDSYNDGITPSPCVHCNKYIKFGALMDFVKSKNADLLVTGHYARVINGKLVRPVDTKRDQTYFLCMVDQNSLKMLHCPLGDFENKDKVREYAEKNNIHVAQKRDSQNVCFILDDYKTFLEDKVEKTKGDIIDINGRIVGTHDGIVNYTIGQRKGINIGQQDAFYVIDVNSKDNTVTVGPKEYLAVNTILIKELNLMDNIDGEYYVQYRSSQKPDIANVTIDNNIGIVNFKEPQYGVAFGQVCAIYKGDIVVGGGVIFSAFSKYKQNKTTTSDVECLL